MRVLIDTNVILDVCFERTDFQADAGHIFSLIEQKKIRGCVSATAITDIYYMARRQSHDKEKALWTVNRISKLFKILKTDERTIRTAIALHWNDFEDSVQYAAAKQGRIQAIITRNKKDYAQSAIPAYTPAEFLQLAQ